MRTSLTALFMGFLATSAIAEPRDNQTLSVGPWAIATNYNTDKFESCTMKRSAGELGITFVRAQDGLVVLLDSPKWKLNRGKAYPVRLVTGSRSVDAQALAETKSVTIAFEDPRLKSELRLANVLEVRGEGATLRVPLDGGSTAFERLETCFNKRATAETNPASMQISSNSETQSTSVAVRINIDKTKQKMTVFLNGVEKYDWPVSTGQAGYSTPSGTYTAASMNEVWYSKEWDNAAFGPKRTSLAPICYLHQVLDLGQGKARSSVMDQILMQARCVRRLTSIKSCEGQNRTNFL